MGTRSIVGVTREILHIVVLWNFFMLDLRLGVRSPGIF